MKQTKEQPATYSGDILQNQFTAYVEKALSNNRVSYYRKLQVLHKKEILMSQENDLMTQTAVPDDYFSSIGTLTIHHEELLRTLNMLSPKDLTIIRMRILYGYSYKKIAVILDMTSGAVRVRYTRAIAKLRKRLEETK